MNNEYVIIALSKRNKQKAKIMFTFTKEIIDGTTYLTTTNSRGNTTMLFESFGEIFIQVNRSPAKALVDIAKPSACTKNLLIAYAEDK